MIKVSKRRVIFPAILWQTLSAAHTLPLHMENQVKCYFTRALEVISFFLSLCGINSVLTHVFWFFSSHRSEVKARQDVKPDFRHPPFTDYRQPPVDYRHPPVTDYRQPPTLDYRQPPSLLDFRQHPAAAQFPLGIPADFRPQVKPQKLSAQVDTVQL